MKKPERYVYPAVFTYEEGQEIAVVFPDLDAATSGKNDEDALFSARELLGCVMAGPTPLAKVACESNERVMLIDVYMPSIRLAHVNRSVNRTVTLPAWLNAAAQEKNINFSQVLQDGLKQRLEE